MEIIPLKVIDKLINVRMHLQSWSFDLEGDNKEAVKKVEDDISNIVDVLIEIRKSVLKNRRTRRTKI